MSEAGKLKEIRDYLLRKRKEISSRNPITEKDLAELSSINRQLGVRP